MNMLNQPNMLFPKNYFYKAICTMSNPLSQFPLSHIHNAIKIHATFIKPQYVYTQLTTFCPAFDPTSVINITHPKTAGDRS